MAQYRISGALFENKRDRGPRFSGVIEIDGKKENIALWPKTSAKGHEYLSVSEDKKQQDKNSSGPSPFKPRATPARGDMDDDIPF